MREIKFRAWIGDRMEYGVLAGSIGNFFAYIDPNDSASAFTTKYDEHVPVMQFTGLTDKNGKEIYEHDILRFPDEVTKAPQEIIWNVNSSGSYSGLRTRNARGWWGDPKSWSDCEIIGNIYKNPELLK